MDLSFLKGTRIVVADIETTSTSVQKTFVREFGIAEYKDGLFVRSNAALFSGGVCEEGALRVHGISDQSVAGKPLFASKAKTAGTFLSDAIVMGHNMYKFDLPIISRILMSQGIRIRGDGPDGRIRVIDTLLEARKRLNLPSNTLQNICSVFGIEHGGHRAAGDCVSCWNVFLKIVEMTGETDLSKYIILY